MVKNWSLVEDVLLGIEPTFGERRVAWNGRRMSIYISSVPSIHDNMVRLSTAVHINLLQKTYTSTAVRRRIYTAH